MTNKTKIKIKDIYKLLVAFGVALIVATFMTFGLGIWIAFHSIALQSHLVWGVMWGLLLSCILAAPIGFFTFLAMYLPLTIILKIHYFNYDATILTLLSFFVISFASMGVIIGVLYGIAQFSITYCL